MATLEGLRLTKVGRLLIFHKSLLVIKADLRWLQLNTASFICWVSLNCRIVCRNWASLASLECKMQVFSADKFSCFVFEDRH